MKSKRKTSSRKKSSRKSPRKGSFATRESKRRAGKIAIHTLNGESFEYPSGTDVVDITQSLYPDTKSYKMPKLIFVDSKQNGYEEGKLPKGVYLLVKIAKKPLPTKKTSLE